MLADRTGGNVRFCLPVRRSGPSDVGIRVLVIEDEAEIADFMVRGLREEGFTVEHAGDGDSAKEMR